MARVSTRQVCIRLMGLTGFTQHARPLVLAAVALAAGCADHVAGSPSSVPPRPEPEVVQSALNANPQTANFVVEAQNSIRIQTGGVVVTGGDVGARGTTGPFLSGNVAIDLLAGVQIQTTRNVLADSVRLGTGVVTGDIQTNHLTPGTGGSHGTVTAFVPLPALPAVASVTPGTTNLTVATGATTTASAFSFQTVTVGTGSTLRLPAGTYQIRDISMSSGARIEAQGPVQIRVSNRIAGTSGAFIGAQSGVTLTAKDIRIEVSGQNGSNGAITATPKSVAFTSGGSVKALMLVPNGTLQLGTGMVARGAFMARDFDAGGSGAQIIYEDGFPNPCTAESCNDNNPCTNDVCSANGCTHSNASNGTACSDGNACTSNDSCQMGSCTAGAMVCTTLAMTNATTFTSGGFSFPVTLSTQPPDATPGDHLQVSATITNSGISLFVNGNLDVQNASAATVTLPGYEESLEYFSVSSHTWVPVALVQFDNAGQHVPPAGTLPEPSLSLFVRTFNAPGVMYSFFPAVVGTTIAPGSTGGWSYTTNVALPAATAATLIDPQQASAVRAVIRFNPIGPSMARDQAAVDLTSFFTGLAIPSVPSITATASYDQGAVTASLSPQSSGSLPPGASALFTGQVVVPAAQTREPFGTDSDYVDYLTAIATQQHSLQVNAQIGTTNAGAGLTLSSSVPVVSASVSGPSDVTAGQPVPVSLALANNGTGVAGPFAVTNTIDGQPQATSLTAPATLAPAQTGNATAVFTAPANRPPGPFTDQVGLTWRDRNGNVYGPITSSLTPTLHNNAQGRLTISEAVTQIIGATVSLTVSASNAVDAPVSGVPVHVVVTGVNARTLDVTTGPDGTATISYTGGVMGSDSVVATATVVSTPITSNAVHVVWATPVGTPCTGRANPLDVVLVIDGSPSMFNGNNVGPAKTATDAFIDRLDFTRDQVAGVLFSGDANLYAPLTTDGALAKGQIDTALDTFAHACDGFCAGGSNFAGALDVAIAELQGPRHRSGASPLLVFLSDGGNTGAAFSPELAQLATLGVRIIALGLGADVDSLVMRGIASSQNDYFYSPTTSTLDWIYASAGQDVCRNHAPIVSAGGNQGAYNVRLPDFLTLNGEIHDDAPEGDSRLTSEWTLISGPGPVSFVDATSPVTHALFGVPGTYVLQLAATDGFLTVADRATITVDSDPSIVGATLVLALSAPGPLNTGTIENVTATFKDNNAVPIANFPVRLAITGANPAAPTAVTNAAGVAAFSYRGLAAGTDTLHATAFSTTFQVDSSSVTVSWNDPSGGPVLTQGWIGSPTHQSSVTGQVPITLAAGITLTSGTVSYWPAAHPDQVHFLSTVAGGPGATVATFDTTVLANDSYVLNLEGTNNTGHMETSDVLVTVTGEYKPGRVVVEVTDFSIPVAGLPITIGRRYDSLERENVGDFGHGWSLALGHPRLEVDQANDVTLTMPGGKRTTFYFRPTNAAFSAGPLAVILGFLLLPAYLPEPGTFGKLTSNGCSVLSIDPTIDNPTPVCFESIVDPDHLNYAPTEYTYTDPYGREFVMAATGDLKSIKDRQGNTLTFTPTGITSSVGPAVTFERDTQGRITKVISPGIGASQQHIETHYSYDTTGDLVAVDLPPTDGSAVTHHTYDASHLLLTTRDPRGNAARTSTYGTDGRIATDTDALGNVTSYAYDLGTRTTTITNPDTGVVTKVFDERGLVLSETDPLGRTTTHEYDANRNETKQTNAIGEATTTTYNANGSPTSVTDSRGRTSRTTYGTFENPTTFIDALGQTSTIEYDDRGLPKRLADTLGTRLSFSSSTQGQPVTVDDAFGNRAYVNYDGAGNVTSQTDWLGRVSKATFDEIGRRVTETSPRGNVRNFNYNPRGTLESFTDSQTGLNGWHRFTYDANDNVIVDFMPFANRSTEYTYDTLNHLTITTYRDGSVVHTTPDFRGNKLTETDESGHITTFEYDLAGQLVRTINADGTVALRDYDGLGRLITATDERGHSTTYEYDTGCGCSDRVTKVTDSMGRERTTEYDALGQRISFTDPAGHIMSFAYDVRGHVTDTNYPDGTTVHDVYDTRGRRVSSTDQTGATTAYGYDTQGELTSVTDALENVTSYAYDADGDLTSVTDANGHTTTYEYDLLKRKTRRTLPLGQFETFAYDTVGNRVGHTDFRGKTTTMAYDTRDRLLSKTPDPGLGEPTASYTYFPTGMRSSMTDASGTTTYTYDQRNRLLTKSAPAGTLTYTYDAGGDLASIRSSNTNGTSVDYAWDAANQLASITDNRAGGLITTTYTPTGQHASMLLPNGVDVAYGYDIVDRVTSIAWQHGVPPAFASWAYTRNQRGQTLSSADAAGRVATYDYDAIGRLVNETIVNDPRGSVGNGTITYALDAVGNRLSQVSTLAALPSDVFHYDANDQLDTEAYDANGNTTSSAGHTYAYDFENRLSSRDSGAVTNTFDGDGNRVAKTVGGVTTKYLVDDLNPSGLLQVLEEVGAGGQVQVRYTYGASALSQTRDVSGTPHTSFYGGDGHGSIAMLMDPAGDVSDTYSYDAWGNIVGSTGTTPNTRLYVGEEFDPHLGLLNLRARFYAPSRGRFTSLDPLLGPRGIPISFHRFLYANGDPVNFLDPSGKQAAVEEAGILVRDIIRYLPYVLLGTTIAFCGTYAAITALDPDIRVPFCAVSVRQERKRREAYWSNHFLQVEKMPKPPFDDCWGEFLTCMAFAKENTPDSILFNIRQGCLEGLSQCIAQHLGR